MKFITFVAALAALTPAALAALTVNTPYVSSCHPPFFSVILIPAIVPMSSSVVSFSVDGTGVDRLTRLTWFRANSNLVVWWNCALLFDFYPW